jgi:hypothetical protein
VMDIATQSEVLLRSAGYETWTWPGGSVPVVCFENASVAGFLHVFGSGESLLADWRQVQQATLGRHAASLRSAGAKAWNVYALFLAGGAEPGLARQIERIEENFSMTRKIARGDLRTAADLRRTLLPLLPVLSAPVIGGADYRARLRSRLSDVPDAAVAAFLGAASASDVARILVDAP